MNRNDQIIRDDAATWAESTRFTADELRRMYLDYCDRAELKLQDVLSLPEWAQQIMGIPNE